MAVAWFVLALTGFTLAAGAVHAAPVVGSASTIVRDVRGMLERDWRTIVIDDNVFQDELIRTGESSAARLIFADRTDFMIGANSEVVLDKFVYDPDSNSGQLLLRATKGLMKFRTGSMSSRSYRIETPVATVGVRGTEFVVKVYEGVTTIQVISGEVIVIDHDGHEVIVKPNERAVVFPPEHVRAAEGPLLITGGDRAHELPAEVREMVAQVVFTEETSQTQLTIDGDDTTTVNIDDDNLTIASPAGTGSGAIKIKTTSQTNSVAAPPPDSNGSALAPTLDLPEDPILDASNPPPPPPPACLQFCFSSMSDLSGWTVSGGGSVATVGDPRGGGGLVMQLTTGSPITISQEIETSGNPFMISFDYLFADQDGTLQVFLDEVMVMELFADPAVTDFQTADIRIDDPALFGRDTLLFQLTFDGEVSDLRLLLDNLSGTDLLDGTAIPIMPSAIGLASGVAFLGWAAARRGNRAAESRQGSSEQ